MHAVPLHIVVTGRNVEHRVSGSVCRVCKITTGVEIEHHGKQAVVPLRLEISTKRREVDRLAKGKQQELVDIERQTPAVGAVPVQQFVSPPTPGIRFLVAFIGPVEDHIRLGQKKLTRAVR